MTRDEAIEKLHKHQFGDNPLLSDELDGVNVKCSANFIDAFVALGMLKVDEPQNKRALMLDKICYALEKAGVNYDRFGVAVSLLDHHLPSTGLKIVEA